MMSTPPSASTGDKSQSDRITASLAEQGGKSVFKLTFRGESTPLVDTGSLNRWAAIGVVDRHKVSLLSDGVAIDGHTIRYADPQATAELERILNRPASKPSHAPAAGHRPGAGAPGAAAQESPGGASFAENVRVTREGFEFHVVYRTRFGQNKTERLEAALDAFQSMRVFKPHVNMQKSGIRLVVTRWDGESFVEEAGIANVEHATPEEVEALIKSNLQGTPEINAASGRTLAHANLQRQVVRVELARKGHDARFHLLLHRLDGTTAEGPILIRPNMPKLAAEGIFRSDVSISVTAMNDRIVIARKPLGQTVVQSESFPLTADTDVKALELVLNDCLKPVPEAEPQSDAASSAAASPISDVPSPAVAVALPGAAVAEEEEEEGHALPSLGSSVPAVDSGTEPQSSALPAAQEVEPPSQPLEVIPQAPPAPVLKPRVSLWLTKGLSALDTAAVETINTDVFGALHRWFDRPVQVNDYDFPAFTIEFGAKDGEVITVEFVLGSHYLLCAFPFGYLRFGPETRIFLNRLGDYLTFPRHALRGAATSGSAQGFAFLVTRQFAEFLRAQGNYKTQFGESLLTAEDLKPEHLLLWPLSQEEKLFNELAVSAAAYGLPVTRDTVVLDPKASVFVGFKKVPSGMEFRDAEDFIRFTPEGLELHEDGEEIRFESENVLLGWALDSQGHVCALYRKTMDFSPPPQSKLLRFLDETEAAALGEDLTMLAALK
jgi:hypothetical protein